MRFQHSIHGDLHPAKLVKSPWYGEEIGKQYKITESLFDQISLVQKDGNQLTVPTPLLFSPLYFIFKY